MSALKFRLPRTNGIDYNGALNGCYSSEKKTEMIRLKVGLNTGNLRELAESNGNQFYFKASSVLNFG